MPSRIKDWVSGWWKEATPSRQATTILLVLATIGIIVLLIVRKPWQWNLPTGGKMRIVDYVRIYSWWAAAANVLLITALAVTASGGCDPLQGDYSTFRARRCRNGSFR